MSIRVGKYNYKTKKQPETPGFVNILIHTTGPLSPYQMMDGDNVFMENYWQFCKIWERVNPQNQSISMYRPDIIRWEHQGEVHFKEGEPTPAYWKWREKGFKHHRWVRYPNGYKNHYKALGSIIGGPDSWELVDYIEARKQIYFPKYKEIAKKTDMYKDLKEMLKEGINIQINEVDGPKEGEEFPYNQVENGSIEVNEKVIKALVNNPAQAFGHGYCLAACLLGIDVEKM